MGGYDDFDEMEFQRRQEEMAEWQREGRPNETFYQYIARKEREFLEAKYPYHFTVTHEGEGGKTSDHDWDRMQWFINERHMERGDHFQMTGDGIGYSSTIWFKDSDIAALFKLSFEIG